MRMNSTMKFRILAIVASVLVICEVASGVLDYRRDDFPVEFVFGSGTSAYQVEGAAQEDGRTPSNWDIFAHNGYCNGATGDIACDGYHKYKEDVKLMADVGLEAYRFSISWSRLIPYGRGPINPKGLQYYNNLINEIISHGIQPHITLFHYDLPQALEDEYGGWTDKKSIEDFVAYADVCFREFGDRVSHWTSFNEANVVAIAGYDMGVTPPGRCSFPFGLFNCTRGNSSYEPYIVAHNLLLAHASVAQLYQTKYKAAQHGFIGLNVFAAWIEPHTNEAENVIAAKRAMEFVVGWFVNPLVFGDYPVIMKKNVGTRLPAFTKSEMKWIKGSFDFIALNHYNTFYVEDNPKSLELEVRDFAADIAVKLAFSHGDASLDLVKVRGFNFISKFTAPSPCLHKLLDYLKDVYGNPCIYIHENGQQTPRSVSINDTIRVEYLHSYIGSMLDAMRNGSNTRGYFTWSFLDVFEEMGYGTTFGLYYVDREDENLGRYPKLSAQWYSNFLKGGNVIRDGYILGVEEQKFARAQSLSYE